MVVRAGAVGLLLLVVATAAGCGMVGSDAAAEAIAPSGEETPAGGGGPTTSWSGLLPAQPEQPLPGLVLAEVNDAKAAETTTSAAETAEVVKTSSAATPALGTRPTPPRTPAKRPAPTAAPAPVIAPSTIPLPPPPPTVAPTTTTIDLASQPLHCQAAKRFIDSGTFLFDGAPGYSAAEISKLVGLTFGELEVFRATAPADLASSALWLAEKRAQLDGFGSLSASQARQRLRQFMVTNQAGLEGLLTQSFAACPDAGLFGDEEFGLPADDSLDRQLG